MEKEIEYPELQAKLNKVNECLFEMGSERGLAIEVCGPSFKLKAVYEYGSYSVLMTGLSYQEVYSQLSTILRVLALI